MSTPPVVKAVMRIIGGATVGSLVAVGGYGVATAFAHTERTEQTTEAVEGLSTVVAHTDLGDIEVVEASPASTEVEVVTRRSGNWRLPRVEQRRDGDRLVIEGFCQDGWWGGCSTDLVVRVPRGLVVDVRSDVGDVTVRGGFTDVSMESATGDLRGESLAAESVHAANDVGDIDLEIAAPGRSVVASSSVGDITVVVPDDGTAYDVHMKTDVGDPRTDVPQDSTSARTIRATSSVGDVQVLVEANNP